MERPVTYRRVDVRLAVPSRDQAATERGQQPDLFVPREADSVLERVESGIREGGLLLGRRHFPFIHRAVEVYVGNMADKACAGCGRTQPSDEEVRLAREGLGAFVDNHCWGHVAGYEPCNAWQDDDGKRYVRITSASDDRILERMHGPLVSKLFRILQEAHPVAFAEVHEADCHDEVRIRKGYTSTISIEMKVWDRLRRDAQHSLRMYAEGFVDGAEAM